jgi:16S rRNA (uracil1498-N3)-methyltransferase
MRISRIFTSAPLQPQQLVQLDEKASHHLGKVLRLTVGAQLILFNGDGFQYPATITAATKKFLTVQTSDAETINRESPLKTHLGIAVSKGDRIDWVIQKATELGVTTLTPLLSERTELKLTADRKEKKLQHWQQIIISACEQCGRNSLPKLHPLQKMDQWVTSVEADKKLVLHHRTEEKLNPHDQVSSAAILIGPEGGLSETEILLAEKNNFQALSVGPRVMRTETAPLATLSILQHLWGDC